MSDSNDDKYDAPNAANPDTGEWHYRYSSPSGGGTRYNGPPIFKPKDGPSDHDQFTEYQDLKTCQFYPIPPGWTAPPYVVFDDGDDD